MLGNALIKLFVKNPDDTENPKVRANYGSLSGIVGIIFNLLLCSAKIISGIIAGSISVIADGFNNLADMGSYIITMIGFRLAGRPADKEHPYGHGRMEYVSAFIVSLLILLVGFELLKESVLGIINGEPLPEYSTVSLVILGGSVIIKLWLFIFNKKLAKKTGSDVFSATAQDSFNDSLATTAILAVALVTRFVNLPFNLDCIMGALVALFILYSGIMAAKETLGSLLGGPPDEKLVKDIQNTILSFNEFLDIHDLIVHNYGPGREFASVHVEVPQDIDIVACHEKIDLCEKLINEKLNIELVIHMDPIETDNAAISEVKAAILKELKTINEGFTLHDFRMTPKSAERTNLIFDAVIPMGLNMPEDELKAAIDKAAKTVDSTYCCVVTFDKDYTATL